MYDEEEFWKRMALLQRRERLKSCVQTVLTFVGFIAGYIAADLLRTGNYRGLAIAVLVIGGVLLVIGALAHILINHIVK